MTAKSKLLRMDNLLIVVEDLEAAKAFFMELGMEMEGETTVEGPWVDSSALVDMNCSDVDIAPDVPHSAKGADALRDAYKSGNLGTLDKEIDATWTGTFFWRPGQMPSRLLKVHVIENLSVSKK